MKQQVKTSEMGVRLGGTPQQYFTLKLFLDGVLVNVHSAKSKSYILGLQQNWNNR